MIKKFDRFILVGSSHVAKQSAKEIKDVIDKYAPDVVAIELDIGRFKKLMSNSKEEKSKFGAKYSAVRDIGVSGYIFAQIAGFVQSRVGKMLNIDPGVDMKTAYLSARDKKIPTALIDLDIRLTLRKFSKLGFRRKVAMFSNIFLKSLKKENREKLQFDVKAGVPDEKVIISMLSIVKRDVPDMYKILIDDRNKFMVKKLLKLREDHDGLIVCVVGAGHVAGMLEYLKENISGSDVVKNNIGFGDGNVASFSFKVDV